MLYLFCGSDTTETRNRVDTFVSRTKDEGRHADVFTVREDSVEESALCELAYGQGLFDKQYITVLYELGSSSETRDLITRLVPLFANSANIFVMAESTLDAKLKKHISAHAQQVKEYNTPAQQKSNASPSVFLLADALGRRKRKEAWTLLHKLVYAGISAEQIHGVLFWQIKTMLLIKKGGDHAASQAGAKPFVVQKTKRFLKNYTEQELSQLLHEWTSAYHSVRSSGGNLGDKIERILLTI